MKIMVTSAGPTLDDQIDSRYGRSPYHLFIETEDMSFQAETNPNLQFRGCAGTPTTKLLAQKGIQVVLTGNCGMGHRDELKNMGIQLILGVSGLVRQVVQEFKQVEAVAGQPQTGGTSAGS